MITPDTPQKLSAHSFLTTVTSGKVREAFEKYIHPEFTHHNQYHAGDRESLMQGMLGNEENFPNKKFEVKRLVEEGDIVVAHSSLELGGNMPPMTVVHFLRFMDGKIIEMWDIAQQLQPDSPNENGPF